MVIELLVSDVVGPSPHLTSLELKEDAFPFLAAVTGNKISATLSDFRLGRLGHQCHYFKNGIENCILF